MNQITETAFIASIISNNMFEQILDSHNEGSMHTHNKIVILANDFYVANHNIEDWEEESAKRGVSDWEECILKFVVDKLKEEAK